MSYLGIHHCIVLGEGAQATEPYQFVLRTRLHPERDPVQMATVMSEEEYEVVIRVVRRMIDECYHPSMVEAVAAVGYEAGLGVTAERGDFFVGSMTDIDHANVGDGDGASQDTTGCGRDYADSSGCSTVTSGVGSSHGSPATWPAAGPQPPTV